MNYTMNEKELSAYLRHSEEYGQKAAKDSSSKTLEEWLPHDMPGNPQALSDWESYGLKFQSSQLIPDKILPRRIKTSRKPAPYSKNPGLWISYDLLSEYLCGTYGREDGTDWTGIVGLGAVSFPIWRAVLIANDIVPVSEPAADTLADDNDPIWGMILLSENKVFEPLLYGVLADYFHMRKMTEKTRNVWVKEEEKSWVRFLLKSNFLRPTRK